jgi:A1 cistron-splicing factor AAR2
METTYTAAVLLLDLPQPALAGIDLLSFTTTPRFRGVKNLPEGFHFAFVGASTTFSERHGVWFEIKSSTTPQLVLLKWSAASETLVTEINEAEVLRWRANLGGLWREGLTPYRQTASKAVDEVNEESSDWPTLTSSINSSLLSRITGSDSAGWRLSSGSSSRRDLEDIPGLSSDDLDLQADKELHFLAVDLRQTWRDGATGRERTDAAQDRSWALNHLIETECTSGDAMEIIGELQFCFLMVLTINNFSCLEQWKRILSLLFTCKKAVASRPDLFIAAIAALRLQLQHCKDAEGGLIDLTDEGGSLLKNLLVRFRNGLNELGGMAVQDVMDELDDLEAYLNQEQGWQFGGTFAKSGLLELEDGEQVRMDTTAFDEDDETGEFAPQVVDLTPEQARILSGHDSNDLHVTLDRTSLNDARSPNVVESSDDESNGESEDETSLDDMDMRY